MDWIVANVNLDNIMQQEHLNNAIGIYRPAGILIQKQGIHRQVPRMLSGIFLPTFID
jgi:hypothetical protein